MRTLIPLLLLTACAENGVTVYNDAPEVTILQPADGGAVPAGTPITVVARVADSQTPSDELDLVLASDIDGAIEATATWSDDEVSLAIAGLTLGAHVLDLSAFDQAQASATDSVTVLAQANQPPIATVTSPIESTRYAAELPLAVRATATDDFTAPQSLVVRWTGIPTTGLPATSDPGGALIGEVDLAIGFHTLTLELEDELAATSSTEIRFEIVDGDGDNDGDVAIEFGGTDCDDEQPTVGLGFDELCDGRDNDCDSVFDEDTTDSATYYRDDDGDGYGDPSVTSVLCAITDGWVTDNTDCDDTDPAIHPLADERCNGLDDDCVGGPAADELSNRDNDSAVTCADCDDDDNTFYPGAPEPCDGLDQSCSGFADDGGQCPCDVDWFGDHAYLFCTDSENWGNALAACDAITGYEIVTISTPVENDFINGVLGTYADQQWWTGFNDLGNFGTWIWDDGSAVSLSNWNQPNSEPNNLTGDEHCMEIGWYDDGTWNDAFCGEVQNYICEAELGATN